MPASRPRFKVISRSGGKSATAAAAYRSATRIEDELTGEVFDYTRKQGVLHSEILLPENAPQSFMDRGTLWNAVEKSELKKNGDLKITARLARDIVVPLSHEFDFDTNRTLLKQWLERDFIKLGMAADFAIHEPDRGGDQRNVHAHVMLSLREMDENGFVSAKSTDTARSWNKVQMMNRAIQNWENFNNQEFERRGMDVRADFSSFESRGIDKEPQQHEGPAVTAKRRRGQAQDSDVANDNDEITKRNSMRAQLHKDFIHLQNQIIRQRSAFEKWEFEKRAVLEAEQDLTRLDLQRRQERESDVYMENIRNNYAPHLKTVQMELGAIDSRLKKTGLIAHARRLLGLERQDREQQDLLKLSIQDAKTRIDEYRQGRQKKDQAERERLETLLSKRRSQQQAGIEKAKERKESYFAQQIREFNERRKALNVENSKEVKPEQIQETGPPQVAVKASVPDQDKEFSFSDYIDELASKQEKIPEQDNSRENKGPELER